MLVVNSQLLQPSSDQADKSGKFILNESAIIFFSTAEQHNSVKLHGLSYEDDYRGNALAGTFSRERIDIRFHCDFSDERVRTLWSRVGAERELALLKERPAFYQGRAI